MRPARACLGQHTLARGCWNLLTSQLPTVQGALQSRSVGSSKLCEICSEPPETRSQLVDHGRKCNSSCASEAHRWTKLPLCQWKGAEEAPACLSQNGVWRALTRRLARVASISRWLWPIASAYATRRRRAVRCQASNSSPDKLYPVRVVDSVLATGKIGRRLLAFARESLGVPCWSTP